MTGRSVTLASADDVAGFRAAARALLAAQVPPPDITWRIAGDEAPSLFDDSAAPVGDTSQPAPPAPALRLPAALLAHCEEALLHAEPQRHALVYRLLWRIAADRRIADDPLDPDLLQVRTLAQAVRREQHKMTAFVRFRLLQDAAGPLQLAWFVPRHHVVRATAPFFIRRFANERWSILTPLGSVRWEPGRRAEREGGLSFGPPADVRDVPPADAGEALWLTYYRHIFNPARLKLSMMTREMPRRYWPRLPEAVLIDELARAALPRTGAMIDAPPGSPARTLRPAPVRVTAAARPIDSLAALGEAVERCRACPIGAAATQAVCGEGPVAPALMFVGEQPGDEEDLRGRPFVGPAGRLFDRALVDLGLERGSVYVANAVKHFKFELRGGRRIHKTAAEREALACSGWLEHEIALVRPRAIVALGATAARSLLGRPVAVRSAGRQWFRRDDGTPVCIALHPAALLRERAGPGSAGYVAWIADLRFALEPPIDDTAPPPPDPAPR